MTSTNADSSTGSQELVSSDTSPIVTSDITSEVLSLSLLPNSNEMKPAETFPTEPVTPISHNEAAEQSMNDVLSDILENSRDIDTNETSHDSESNKLNATTTDEHINDTSKASEDDSSQIVMKKGATPEPSQLTAEDLVKDQLIYVRGRRAAIVQFEIPLLYWRYIEMKEVARIKKAELSKAKRKHEIIKLAAASNDEESTYPEMTIASSEEILNDANDFTILTSHEFQNLSDEDQLIVTSEHEMHRPFDETTAHFFTIDEKDRASMAAFYEMEHSLNFQQAASSAYDDDDFGVMNSSHDLFTHEHNDFYNVYIDPQYEQEHDLDEHNRDMDDDLDHHLDQDDHMNSKHNSLDDEDDFLKLASDSYSAKASGEQESDAMSDSGNGGAHISNSYSPYAGVSYPQLDRYSDTHHDAENEEFETDWN